MLVYSAVSLWVFALPYLNTDQSEAQRAPAAEPLQAPVPSKAPPIPVCNDYRLQYDYPLLPKQRACIYASNLLSTSAVFGAGFAAGYAQLFKTDPPQWGVGPQGYAISYGTRYAAGMAKATGEYIAALAFHEDPRPRQSGATNVVDRILYAAASLFIDSRSCHTWPATHTVLGALSSGFSGMAFYPNGQNTVTDALKRSAMSLGGSAVYAEFYEFEPDFFRVLRKWFSPKLQKPTK